MGFSIPPLFPHVRLTCPPPGTIVGWQDYGNASVDPCVPVATRWTGLTCGVSPDRVTAVALGTRGLRGQLPDVFSGLTAVTSIDLSGNQLSGSIPGSLATLASLRALLVNLNALVRERRCPCGCWHSCPVTLFQLRIEPLPSPCTSIPPLGFSSPPPPCRLALCPPAWVPTSPALWPQGTSCRGPYPRLSLPLPFSTWTWELTC